MVDTTKNGDWKLTYVGELKDGKLHFDERSEISSDLRLLREGAVELTIKNHYGERSNQQNKLMWLWFTIIGQHIGYTSQQVKSILQYKFLTLEQTLPNGDCVKIIRGTSELNKKEFRDFLDEVYRWSIEYLNCDLPLPDSHVVAG